MKLLFVVNPISGGVDKEPFLKEAGTLCDFYDLNHHIFKTTGKNDEEELQKLLTEYKPDKVLSVGGDGTTLFTSKVLLNTGYPMAIIPLGSANGMATELFVNPNPVDALKEAIMSDMVRGLDILLVNNEHYTLHIGDVGINASIVEAYEKDPNRGMVTYAKYFIEELKKLDTFKVKVTANGETTESELFMAAICNSRKYGTGVPLNTIGSPMDGVFELVLIEHFDLASLIAAGLSKFNDKFMDNQKSRVITTTEAIIEFEEPRLLQLDGEVIQPYKRIDVKVLPGAVKLITNQRNIYA